MLAAYGTTCHEYGPERRVGLWLNLGRVVARRKLELREGISLALAEPGEIAKVMLQSGESLENVSRWVTQQHMNRANQTIDQKYGDK